MSIKDIFSRTIEVFADHDGSLTVKNASDSTISNVRVMFGNPAGFVVEPVEFSVVELAPGEEAKDVAKVSSIDPESDKESVTIDAEYECVTADGSESKNTLKVSVDV